MIPLGPPNQLLLSVHYDHMLLLLTALLYST